MTLRFRMSSCEFEPSNRCLSRRASSSPATLDELIDTFEHKVGPRNGAQVVARAWVDPEFKRRLLDDATEVVAEMGFVAGQHADLVAVKNTEDVHSMVVCTLCSCYPWAVLGLPPMWYKSAAYRSRTVIDTREVLEEFGVHVPQEVEVRVWYSTSELRYIVLPLRPAGIEGMSETELAELVTRNSMIGTGVANIPELDAVGSTACTTWAVSGLSSSRRTSRCSTPPGRLVCTRSRN